jgi:hypothetical protein
MLVFGKKLLSFLLLALGAATFGVVVVAPGATSATAVPPAQRATRHS